MAEHLVVVTLRKTRPGPVCLNLDDDIVEDKQCEDSQGLPVARERHQE